MLLTTNQISPRRAKFSWKALARQYKLEDQLIHPRSLNRLRMAAALLIVSGIILMLRVSSVLRHDYGFAIIGLLSGVLCIYYSTRTNPSQRTLKAVKKITKSNDVKVTPILINFMLYENWPLFREENINLQNEIHSALTRLLYKVKENHEHLFSDRQRECLYFSLVNISNFQLALAILTALEQIGDRRAIPYLQRLVNKRIQSDGQMDVKLAASKCLKLLNQRFAENSGNYLLLPSDEKANNVNLLHPCSPRKDKKENHSQQQLLRPIFRNNHDRE